jgi:hypothetical protein
MAFIGNRNEEPPARQSVDPNSSFLMADSQSRDIKSDPWPTDFSFELSNSTQGARRITHRNLQWTQPIWTHNLTDWELVISFSQDGSPGGYTQKFVTYAMPWITFSTFAGRINDSLDFQIPEPESYCAMLTAALQTGLRTIEDPDVVLTWPNPTFPNIDPTKIFCRYSRYRGLVIYIEQTTFPLGLLFKMERCSWMSVGHNVHGFGIKKQDTEYGEIYYIMEDSLYENGVTTWFSSATPIGVYSRFAFVFSREINRNRKITSFTNLATGGILNSTECTVVPMTFDKLCLLKNYVTDEDPTIINLRRGDQLQEIRISMADEFGEIIPCGDYAGYPFDLYAAWLNIKGFPPLYDLNTSIYAAFPTSNPMYDTDAITAALVDQYNFFVNQKYVRARMEPAAPIVHYFEITMI